MSSGLPYMSAITMGASAIAVIVSRTASPSITSQVSLVVHLSVSFSMAKKSVSHG